MKSVAYVSRPARRRSRFSRGVSGQIPAGGLHERAPGRRRQVEPGRPPPAEDEQAAAHHEQDEGGVGEYHDVGEHAINHRRRLRIGRGRAGAGGAPRTNSPHVRSSPGPRLPPHTTRANGRCVRPAPAWRFTPGRPPGPPRRGRPACACTSGKNGREAVVSPALPVPAFPPAARSGDTCGPPFPHPRRETSSR